MLKLGGFLSSGWYGKNASLVLSIWYNTALRYLIVSLLYNLYSANNIKLTIV